MASLFGRFKGSGAASSPGGGGLSPTKKDGILQQTPLERLLDGAGPIRTDGTDKFWGMENFGNTCYCNSILQCLYYSEPFREQVLRYPTPAPQQPPTPLPNGLSRINTDPSTTGNENTNGNSPSDTQQAASPNGPTAMASNATLSPGRKPTAPPSSAPPGNRPEDKPDSPEYKKKHALLAGPILEVEHDLASKYGMSESLFTSLKDLFEAILAARSRQGVVSPKRLLSVLKGQSDIFNTGQHQDAHEFLNLLLNEVVSSVEEYSKKPSTGESEAGAAANALTKSLASAINSAPNAGLGRFYGNGTGWVHDLFEGTLTSETKCLTCENISLRDEPFLDLSVDLEQHSSVTSCLRKFSQEEMLCERNKFHCDNCSGLQEAEKRMKIKRLPRILALHLKRFKYTEDLQRLQKLFHRVVYPYYLRLFNTTDDAEDPDRLYELYAVVVHIGGGPYHGHYVSIIKTKDWGWLLFDDEMVEAVDKSFVMSFFGDKPGQACAYVLFYQETTLEAVRKEQAAEGLAANRSPQTVKDGAIIKPTGVSEAYAANTQPLSPVHSVNNPLLSVHDQSLNLDHAATAPAAQTTQGQSNVRPGSDLPLMPTKSKKERAEEERKLKLAEKEREKTERQRLRDIEAKRREYEKQQRLEVAAAVAASKESKAEEDARKSKEAPANGAPAASGHRMSSSFSRFRHGSKSIREKSSRFFGSGSSAGPGGSGGAGSGSGSSKDDPHNVPLPLTPAKKDGSYHNGPPSKRESTELLGSAPLSNDAGAHEKGQLVSEPEPINSQSKPLPPLPLGQRSRPSTGNDQEKLAIPTSTGTTSATAAPATPAKEKRSHSRFSSLRKKKSTPFAPGQTPP